jgi:hypothetical protein
MGIGSVGPCKECNRSGEVRLEGWTTLLSISGFGPNEFGPTPCI